MSVSAKFIGQLSGPMAFLAILFFVHPEGMSEQANAVLAATAWIAIWWITEAIPIAATALLPIVLFPLTGAVSVKATTAQYGHRFIFLYVGGFFLAIAIEKWGLHRRIALNIIQAIGTDVTRIILGFMTATAALSMWISNTATSVLMLPIGLAIVTQLRDRAQAAKVNEEHERFGKALMLAIAYSASIGGMATLIGTPPNLVLAGVIQELYGIELTFAQWILIGLPLSCVLLVICWLYLTRVAFRFPHREFAGGREEIRRQLKSLGGMSREEKALSAVFCFAALAWIFRPLLQRYVPALRNLDDTVIAMIFGLLLFLIRSSSRDVTGPRESLLQWEDTSKLPWGIVLLFGGGMALAEGFKASGLAIWVGSQTSLLQSISLLVFVIVLVSAVNFLTEVTSNLATTSMLLPILASMAQSMGVHPLLLMVGATLAASCAFMLPVATPPNAVVFGSGLLRIPDMVRVGLWMNLISILLVSAFTYYLVPVVWNIRVDQLPLESIVPVP